MRSTLPWRLQIFDKFPTRPQMVRLKKRVDGGDFPAPRLRQSFTNQFVWRLEEEIHLFPFNIRDLEGKTKNQIFYF